MIGTVYKSTGSWYSVKTDEGKFYQCKIKGKLRLENFKSTNPVAVGDRVNFSLEHNDEENLGIIQNILERKNYIVRKSVNLSKQSHICLYTSSLRSVRFSISIAIACLVGMLL